ncbi:LysR family transcriptional regulator [Nocardioides sp. W3-2-3]|uniref:serine hydrolase n=1 Tax=Nocardioides convexus TaxID=2712224 RepID=UPI002418150A|nr:serine hydrolase [Nocardioides convexus]NGZ99983.1 LysR family transcriptional regulator [Nocardioides convexus]
MFPAWISWRPCARSARSLTSAGFTRGAEACGQPQPVASRRVAALERHLGVSLLRRSSRKVDLTAEGERLLPLADDVLAGVERIERAFGDAGGLVVAVPEGVAAASRAAVRRGLPGLRVGFAVADPPARETALRTGAAALALLPAAPDAADVLVPLGIAHVDSRPPRTFHLDGLRRPVRQREPSGAGGAPARRGRRTGRPGPAAHRRLRRRPARGPGRRRHAGHGGLDPRARVGRRGARQCGRGRPRGSRLVAAGRSPGPRLPAGGRRRGPGPAARAGPAPGRGTRRDGGPRCVLSTRRRSPTSSASGPRSGSPARCWPATSGPGRSSASAPTSLWPLASVVKPAGRPRRPRRLRPRRARSGRALRVWTRRSPPAARPASPPSATRAGSPPRTCCRLALAVSDNAATDLLLDRLGRDEVAARIVALGFPEIVLRHPMRAIYGTSGTVTAAGLALTGGGRTPGGGHVIDELDPARANVGTARSLVTLLDRVWTDGVGAPGVAQRLREMLGHQARPAPPRRRARERPGAGAVQDRYLPGPAPRGRRGRAWAPASGSRSPCSPAPRCRPRCRWRRSLAIGHAARVAVEALRG